MEELRKLERVQKTISLMEAQNVVPSEPAQPDSSRFLANLIHLLIQPCGELDLETKCCLVSHHIPKISTEFLQEVTSCLSEEDTCRSVLLHDGVEKRDCDLICDDFEELGMIAFDAMQRANSTLEDFCRSYFMFHDLDVNRPQLIFRYLPLLSFTESFIYQLDNFNEKLLQLPSSFDAGIKKGSFMGPDQSPKSMESFKTQPFRPLTLLLDRNGLLTERFHTSVYLSIHIYSFPSTCERHFKCQHCLFGLYTMNYLVCGFRIRQELLDGEEYWALERKLCLALKNDGKASEIAIEDAMRAIHLKSFDYRVLNLLLFQLRGEKVNELHMEFLSASEFLVEIADDLFDYEEDVLENSFNILRMFVRIYGPSTAKTMMAKCICEGEDKYNHLLKKLDPQLASEYQRRCEEATKEGGKVLGPALGSWNIPAVIADEELYRSNLSNRSGVMPDQ